MPNSHARSSHNEATRRTDAPLSLSKDWNSHSIRLLVASGLFLMAAIAIGAGMVVLDFRNRAVVDSQRELQNTALILAGETDRSFQALELVQLSLIERLQSLGVSSRDEFEQRMSTEDIHFVLKDKISGLPNIDAITLINQDGKLVNFSRYWPIPPVNVSDRDYFNALKHDIQLTSFISEPVRNRGTGTWTIYRAQKILAPNGTFLGIVLGAMELRHFETFFSKIALNPQSSISLFRRDGVLLARYPRVDSLIGKTFEGTLFKQLLANSNHGVGRQRGVIDGEERLIAASAVAGYPLAVVTTTTLSGALSEWLKQTRFLVGIVSLGVLVIGATMLLIGRQQLRNQRHSRQVLEQQATKLDAALNNMSQGLVMLDADERLVVCNDRYVEMYGLSRDVVSPGCTLSELLKHRATSSGFFRNPEQYQAGRLAELVAKGTVWTVETTGDREISISSQPMPGGGWVVTHEDVTERRTVEAKLSYMSMHDPLTNLPNRIFLHQATVECFDRLVRGETFAILFLDLDRFKVVNDSLGYAFGDQILCQASIRFQNCIRPGDTIAHLGGDEFLVLQRTIQGPSDPSKLASRFVECVSAPFELDGQQVTVGVSVGIAIAPNDASDTDELLKNAGMALHRAKSDGGSTYRFFEPGMDDLMRSRRTLEMDLRKALANGEFELHYQAIVSIPSGQICAFEALLRWNHPDRGLVSPAEFIPLAEETGLIVSIGEWVICQACAEAVQWPRDIRVAINLSPVQFRTENLLQVVLTALEDSGLDAKRLELEITESALLLENKKTLAMLHQLRALGARISMDDFGTGYSSISYLRSFPFDKIKIDQSFVRDLSHNQDSMAIVRAVIGLGNSLGITTTGEGVETQVELDYLDREGCSEAQGYFFSKPLPAKDAVALLEKATRTKAA